MNKWTIGNNVCCPLGSVLLCNQLEPYKNGDSDLVKATLSRYFDVSVNWLNSFQFALNGLDNRGTSITGFIVGGQIASKYFASL